MIDAKIAFMNQLQEQLSGTLTVDQMAALIRAGNSILDGYSMDALPADDVPDDLLDCYVSAMKVESRSPKTIERYTYVIGRLMAFAKVPTRRITVYHLRNWIAAEKARGVSDSTLEGCRQVFSAYFNWLQRESLIEKNPTVNLGPIKCEKKKKKVISDIEMERLNRNCKNDRGRAIIHFLRSTGCRVSEMTALNRTDVDTHALECVVHGKGNKERTVYLDAVAGVALVEYLRSRTDDCEALFVNRFHERIQADGVRFMLNTLAERAGVEHVHPHKFRRTLATGLARHGMPLQEVSRVLGHEKLDTTMLYVNIDNEDVKHDYRRYA